MQVGPARLPAAHLPLRFNSHCPLSCALTTRFARLLKGTQCTSLSTRLPSRSTALDGTIMDASFALSGAKMRLHMGVAGRCVCGSRGG